MDIAGICGNAGIVRVADGSDGAEYAGGSSRVQAIIFGDVALKGMACTSRITRMARAKLKMPTASTARIAQEARTTE